jgi:hypothetical protein
MAKFYSANVVFKSGTTAQATCVGNNAAWVCLCGSPLLGPHEDIYPIDPCPRCSRTYKIHRGARPSYVRLVEEV